MKPRRWHRVEMAEVSAIIHDHQKRGICYNFCTHDALVARYGKGNLIHRMGHGWYKLVSKGDAK